MPRITKIGSSHGVVIPASTLSLANLAPDDQVVLAPVQDGVLIAAEASGAGRMITAMLESMDQFSDTYRTLASEALSDEG